MLCRGHPTPRRIVFSAVATLVTFACGRVGTGDPSFVSVEEAQAAAERAGTAGGQPAGAPAFDNAVVSSGGTLVGVNLCLLKQVHRR